MMKPPRRPRVKACNSAATPREIRDRHDEPSERRSQAIGISRAAQQPRACAPPEKRDDRSLTPVAPASTVVSMSSESPPTGVRHGVAAGLMGSAIALALAMQTPATNPPLATLAGFALAAMLGTLARHHGNIIAAALAIGLAAAPWPRDPHCIVMGGVLTCAGFALAAAELFDLGIRTSRRRQ